MPRRHAVSLLVLAALSLLVACAPEERAAQLDDLVRWEDRRLAPTDSLAALLGSPDAHVRRAALRTAGRIGRTDVLPAMLDRLDDRSQAVRAQAAFSLGLLGGDVAVPALTRTLRDHAHRAVREAACRGLAHQEHDGAMLIDPALHGETRVSAAAWTALRRVASRAHRDTLVAAIRAGLGRDERAVRWRVLRCAERVPDSTLVDQIAPFATDRDVQVRVHALRALGHHEGPAALEAVLRSGERHGRLDAHDLRRVMVAELRALGSLAAPVLAADAEGEHASAAGRASAHLIRGAQSDDPHVAATALAAMTAATEELTLPLAAERQESLLPVWRIRMVRAARDRLGDAAPAVRGAACRALGALRGEGAHPDLLAMLEDNSAAVAADAARAVIRLRQTDAELRAAWRLATRRPALVREAMLSALAGPWPTPRQPDVAGDSLVTRDRERRGPAHASRLYAMARAALAGDEFPVRAAAATALGHLPGGLALSALLDGYDEAARLGVRRGEVQLAILRALQALHAADRAGRPPFAPHGDVVADAPAGPVAVSDSLRDRSARLLRQAFDDPDPRLRLAARACAVAGDLLPGELIPAVASLRETLPAVARDPAQPALRAPFDAPRVRVTTDAGAFVIALDGDLAPNTCATFLHLVERGFHDGLTTHRVVPDFVVQGGCPRGDGWGGPGWTLRSEWSRRPFRRGAVGLAHGGKDTGGSQWFVCLSPQPHLDGRYTLFGEVVDGLEVVDRLLAGDHYRMEIVPE
jgi:cyclophilin family peptidyl-prolyl cis-trans isomerase/HEAT repeat protein